MNHTRVGQASLGPVNVPADKFWGPQTLGRAVDGLSQLCATMLHRRYPRLTRPPLNLQTEELLSAVVERLLKALGKVRPASGRQFFTLASQHMRWELNDVARRLDKRAATAPLVEEEVLAPASDDSELSTTSRRIFAAIDKLPEAAREAFDLVRIQGLSQAEAAEVMGVSAMTVRRRLNRGLQLLTEVLRDLRPEE